VAQRVETLTATLTKLARTTHVLSAGQLEPNHAAALAADIAAALPDLVEFQRRLRLRGNLHGANPTGSPSFTRARP